MDRFFIVITSADLGKVLQFISFLPSNQADFGVSFVVFQAVDNFAASIFQNFGPVDIVGFVKASA